MLARFGHRIASLRRPQTIIYLSTIGVYGDRHGEWVDESMLPAPSPAFADPAAGRKSLGGDRQGRAQKVFILRLAGIYGPGRNALVN